MHLAKQMHGYVAFNGFITSSGSCHDVKRMQLSDIKPALQIATVGYSAVLLAQ